MFYRGGHSHQVELRPRETEVQKRRSNSELKKSRRRKTISIKTQEARKTSRVYAEFIEKEFEMGVLEDEGFPAKESL